MQWGCTAVSGKQTGNAIKEIKKKSSTVVVILSNGEKLKLSHSSYTEFRLYEGKELGEEELASLLSYEKEGEFYDYALRLLGKDNYTVSAITNKLLSKGADAKQTSSIIERLKKEDLLDDERYAKVFVEDIAELRCLGKNKILAELKHKGIDEGILSKLEFPEEKEFERACTAASLLDKKYAKAANGAKKDKAIRALITRGFSYDVASRAIEEKLTPNDKEEEKSRLLRDFELAYARYSRKYEGKKIYESVIKSLLRKGYDYDDISSLIVKKKEEQL